MRFSLIHLLLVFPAWSIAYFVAPYVTLANARITWRHDVAATGIRQIRLWAENATKENPNCSFAEFDFTLLWNEMGGNADPWGNPYRLVEMDKSTDGLTSTVHAYSLGRDGYTQTEGNDLDDINSWNYDRSRFYLAEIAFDYRRTTLMRTVWLTPLIYLVILVGFHTMWSKPIPGRLMTKR